MTEQTYEVNGVRLTQAQAERVAAEVAARQQVRYVQLRPYPSTIYRIQPDGTTDFIGPQGQWQPLGCRWPNCRTSEVPVSAWDAERQMAERARRMRPTFQVGDWVTRPDGRTRRVGKAADAQGIYSLDDARGRWDGGADGATLRHATPEEIAAAKRIELVDRLIVRHNVHKHVLQWRDGVSTPARWINLTSKWGWEGALCHDLTTDHYTVLDSYTVEGAR